MKTTVVLLVQISFFFSFKEIHKIKMYNLLILILYFLYRLLCLLEENVKLNISVAAQPLASSVIKAHENK